MSARFERIDRLSSWRRISLHMWRRPRDPTVYGNLDIDMSRALAYLGEANDAQAASGRSARVTVTHLVTKAIAKAVREFPDANAIVSRRWLYRRRTVDVYCQVATDGGSDLSGLKIADADSKSALDIAEEMQARVENVLSHRDRGSERTKSAVARVPHFLLGVVLRFVEFLTYDLFLDLERFGIEFDQFGSAMVSNVGSFGIGHGLAPLVPASRVPIVLLVGEIVERAVVRDGQIMAAPGMNVGCTFDHRLIDGYQAGQMARVVKEALHDPYAAFGMPTRSSSAGGRLPPGRRDTTSTDPIDNAYMGRRPGFVREEDRNAPERSG
jgi:pyruvate dehydrogenase E2 component (dihydrolipoamide acetyltransferase)